MNIRKNNAGFSFICGISIISFLLALASLITACVFMNEKFSSPATNSGFYTWLALLGLTLLLQAILFALIAIFPIFSTDSNFSNFHYILSILAIGYISATYMCLSTLSYSNVYLVLLTATFSLMPMSILSLFILFLGKCYMRDGVSLKPYYISTTPYNSSFMYEEKLSEEKERFDSKWVNHAQNHQLEATHYCNGCYQNQSQKTPITFYNRSLDLPFLSFASLSIFMSIHAFVWGGILYARGKIMVNGVPWYASEEISQTIGAGALIIGLLLVYQAIIFCAVVPLSSLITDSIFKKTYYLLSLLPIGYTYGIYLILSYCISNPYLSALMTAVCAFFPTGLVFWLISHLHSRLSK